MKRALAIILLLISLQAIGQVNPLPFTYADKEFAVGQTRIVNVIFKSPPCGRYINNNSTDFENPIVVDSLVTFLNANPTLYVELGMHTDSRATLGYTIEFSFKRARQIFDYLITKGIAANRMVCRGYGETKLTNHCADGVKCTEEEHQANRRLEVKIVGFNKLGFDYDDAVFYPGQITTRRNIFFTVSHWGLTEESMDVVDSLADFMLQHPGFQVEVSAHSDSRGTTKFNLEYSARKAKAIKDHLIAGGVWPERIETIGYGESQPLNKCVDGVKCEDYEYQVNRRFEFKITSLHKPTFSYTDTVFYVGQKMRISRILFMTTPWGFSNETFAPLDTMYNFMVTNPGLKFEIGSYTDCRSSSAYNLDLSLKRAKMVAEYLISKGIAQERLTYVGYGESQPLNKCVDGVKCTEEEHQVNRRVVFTITQTE